MSKIGLAEKLKFVFKIFYNWQLQYFKKDLCWIKDLLYVLEVWVYPHLPSRTTIWNKKLDQVAISRSGWTYHINCCFKKCRSIIKVKQVPVKSDIYNNLNYVSGKKLFISNYYSRFQVQPSSNRQLQLPMYFWKCSRWIMTKNAIKRKQEKPPNLTLCE